MTEQTADGAEGFGERPEFEVLREGDGRGNVGVELERDDRAEPGHLPARDLVIRMIRERRVDHASDAVLFAQPGGERFRVVAVLVHAQRERLEAAQYEEAVLRTGHGADRVLVELQLV